MTDYTELKHIDLGEFVDWVWALKTERDQLKEENESIHKHWANESNNVRVLTVEVMRLTAENEALRLEREGKVLCDLELFETLRDSANTEADEHRQFLAAYRPQRQDVLDLVVKQCDVLIAAMSKEG